MARKPTPPRVIPNFVMDRPWSDPVPPEQQEGLASMAAFSGVPLTNRAITDFVRQLDNSAYQKLVAASDATTNGGRG